jgi:hypothetical protein
MLRLLSKIILFSVVTSECVDVLNDPGLRDINWLAIPSNALTDDTPLQHEYRAFVVNNESIPEYWLIYPNLSAPSNARLKVTLLLWSKWAHNVNASLNSKSINLTNTAYGWTNVSTTVDALDGALTFWVADIPTDYWLVLQSVRVQACTSNLLPFYIAIAVVGLLGLLGCIAYLVASRNDSNYVQMKPMNV